MSPALAQARAARPDPLKAEAGCDHYRGVPIGANDSTQQFELMICTTDDGVRAKVQTSSLVSGWSVRQSVGRWDASGRVLTLQETEFLESRPEPGWRFCLIDSIVLEKTESGLTGNYVSEACNDRAQLELVKLGPAGASASESGGERPASPTPTPPREREVEPEPEPEPKPSGCACEVAGSSSDDGWPMLVMLGFLGLAATRRRIRAAPWLLAVDCRQSTDCTQHGKCSLGEMGRCVAEATASASTALVSPATRPRASLTDPSGRCMTAVEAGLPEWQPPPLLR